MRMTIEQFLSKAANWEWAANGTIGLAKAWNIAANGVYLESDADSWICYDCYILSNYTWREASELLDLDPDMDYDNLEHIGTIGNLIDESNITVEQQETLNGVLSEYAATEIKFSWASCDACGSTLGGPRWPTISELPTDKKEI